jgi:hypothetical protein
MGLQAAVPLGHMPWALTKEEEEEPNSQIGLSFVRRNALHSEASVLGAVLQESSSVSHSAGSEHSVCSQTNINKGLLPQGQRCPSLPHEVV